MRHRSLLGIRRWALPAVLALSGVYASAPTLEVEGQIRGGVNLADFFGDDVADSDERLGLNLGLSIPLVSIGPVTLSPEVHYAQKGARQVLRAVDGREEPGDAASLDFSLQYIEVPVLLRVEVQRVGPDWLGIHAGAGPTFAWQLDCRFTTERDPERSWEKCGEPFEDLETAMDSADRGAALVAGAGASLGRFGAVELEGRYVHGLRRVDGTADNLDVHNRAFALLFGYDLTLGSR